jgi:hypothetical protein
VKARLWPIGWPLVWLVAAMLFVQIMLAVHGIGHAFEPDHDADAHHGVCLECLALAGVHGAPPPVLPGPVGLPAAAATEYAAVPPAPTFTFRAVFRSRAPPVLPS